MLKLLFLTHRWLGITLGIVMVLWCLSGIVMMYKPYPELSETEFLSLMPELSLADCCRASHEEALSENSYQEFHVQMLGNLPVLHLTTEEGILITVDLRHDRVFHSVQELFGMRLAEGFAGKQGYPAANFLDRIHNDQWTVYGAYNPHRPLYHFAAGDDAGTEWYISSRTGEVIQQTTRAERIWGYLGAVIHWLYPTILRERVQLWSQVVIWLTVIGIFLTATGLYFGLRQYRQRKSGRKSPYRGLSLWHHYAGLVFGLLTFTWVLSGLFSMQPGGLMEGEGYSREAAMLRDGSLAWSTIRDVTTTLGRMSLPSGTVRVEGKLSRGELALYSVSGDGARKRFDGAGVYHDPLTANDLAAIGGMLSPDGPPLEQGMISVEDNYYYNHHEVVQLPAYRVIVNDGHATRYYLDPVSGEILNKIDTEDKWYRWLHYGMHRGDFSVFLRSRPVWDIFMVVFMLGVTGVCITGMLMGFRRLGRM